MSYFLAKLLSHLHPDHEMQFTDLAAQVAQSRIDIGVHFPTDCEVGRYVGEYCASSVIWNDTYRKPRVKIHTPASSFDIKEVKSEFNDWIEGLDLCDTEMRVLRKRKPFKASNMVFREAVKRHGGCKGGLDLVSISLQDKISDKALRGYVSDLSRFIIRSNEIERYHVPYDESVDASIEFMKGYPPEYCTENSHIRSHLDGLMRAANTPIRTISDIMNVHKGLDHSVLEKGEPGMLRSFSHMSPTGVVYPEPKLIPGLLNFWINHDWDNPFQEHAAYEIIHPFCDGNGRSGRFLLAKRLGFNFDKVNSLISEGYIDRLVDFAEENEFSNMLKNRSITEYL